MVAWPNALAFTTACQVTERWFSPHFSVFAEFGIRQWTAEVSSLSLFGRLAGSMLLIGLLPLPPRLFRMFGTSTGGSSS